MARTRAEMLAFALSLALSRLRIRSMRRLLTEDDRRAIAQDVVRQLREFGDPWELSRDVPDKWFEGR